MNMVLKVISALTRMKMSDDEKDEEQKLFIRGSTVVRNKPNPTKGGYKEILQNGGGEGYNQLNYPTRR